LWANFAFTEFSEVRIHLILGNPKRRSTELRLRGAKVDCLETTEDMLRSFALSFVMDHNPYV
jgi:hypothetical protein